MAKGNDGNLLQHSIECSAASWLVAPFDAHLRHLNVTLTHGMAPYEPFVHPRLGAHNMLDAALAAATQHAVEGEHPLIAAYRATAANSQHYPNSAELLAATVAGDLPNNHLHLSGRISDIDPGASAALQNRWHAAGVAVHQLSWRAMLELPGEEVDAPWLISLDPNTYRPEPAQDDHHFYPGDWPRLAATTALLAQNGHPGAVAVFCYSLRPYHPALPGSGNYEQFIADGADFGDQNQLHHEHFELTANGGNRHVALLFSASEPLLQQVTEDFHNLIAAL